MTSFCLIAPATALRSYAQEGGGSTLEGLIKDDSGPLLGATVIVKNTTRGTTTDMDGKFRLEGLQPGDVLQVTYVGYDPYEVTYTGQTTLDILMTTTANQLNAVVVTAMGIERQSKTLSYAAETVGGDDVADIKSVNMINALQGKAAGLQITPNSTGAGGSSKILFRGNKSINGSNQPLVVVDGVPLMMNITSEQVNSNWGAQRDGGDAMSTINPDDIASISLLKGASAAALYGAVAANGAIMITTKKGKAGALKVTLSSNTEFLDPFVQPEFQNRYGTGSNGVRSGSGIYSWGQKLLPAARYGYTPADFFETGHVYTNAVTVSGGTDKNQTYFSAASVNSDGIIPNNEYDRYNFTFRNTSYFLKDRLKLDASASYIYQKDQNMTNQGVYSNPLVPAYLFPRGENFDLYRRFERYNEGTKLMEQFWSADMEGGDLRMQNPYWINYRNLRNTDKKRYMLSFSASYDILPWLNVAGRVRIDNSNSLYTQKLYASSNTTITEGGKNGHYTEARAYDTQTYADLMVNINKTFGEDWSLNANIGASINNIKTDELSYRGPIQENGLPNIFNVFDLDDTKKRAEKVGWHDQTQSNLD